MRNGIVLSISLALAATGVAALAIAPRALAKGRPLGPPSSTRGTCSDGTSTFTLKSMFDDEPFAQTVGAELEVDSGVVGQSWEVTLTDNGVTFFDALVPTIGPEGGLNVTHPDAGAFSVAHTIVARAVEQATGAVCEGQVVDPPLH